MKILKNKAFTLSEVLITLGIIGVVAAITIPTMISKYREKATITRVQKAYSLLSLAFRQITEEYGVTPTNYPGIEDSNANCYACAGIKRDLYKSQLGGHSRTNGYIYYLNGSVWFRPVSNLPSLDLNNGMTITFGHDRNCGGYWLQTGKLTACGMGSDILVDINGANNGPNTLGKDVFGFTTALDGIYPDGLKGGYAHGTCTLKGTGRGCAAYILSEKNQKYLKK